MQENIDKTYGADLMSVVQALSDEYQLLEQLCAKIDQHVDLVDRSNRFADYINHVTYFNNEVRDFVKGRRVAYVPYILELAEKNDMEHDCKLCSGNCDMQHTARLFELRDTIEKMLSASDYVQGELSAIYAKEPEKDSIQALNSEMDAAGNFLRTLLTTEVRSLIPLIKEAQKSINAHS